MSQKKLKKIKKEVMGINTPSESKNIEGIRTILKNNWKFLVCLLVGIFLLYFNSLHGDFVSDDYATITQDTMVTNVWYNVKTLLSPIIYKSIIAAIFGVTSSIPFHVGSLILYMLVCISAFVFLTIVFGKTVSVFTTIIFAILPIHVEAVSWISGEPYLIMSIFILISLIFFVLFLNKKDKKYFWFLMVSLLMLYFTDRFRGFSVILLGFLYLMAFKKELNIKIDLLKISLISFGILIFILVFSWPMVQARIDAVNGGINSSDSLFYNPFFQYPTSVAKYLQLMLIPVDLTLYHTMYVIPVWLNWLIFLTYLTTVVYFFFKDKKIFFALGFIFLAAVASMTPIKVSWLVAERYIFLGSLGFCLFLVLFLKRFVGKKTEPILFVLFLVVLGGCGYRIIMRNIDWQTNHNLWVNTCQVSPNSHNAWNNIGDDYDKLAQLETTDEGKIKQYENSIKGFTQSTVIKPNYADAFHNRANIFYKMGRFDLARDSYETGLSFNPGMYQSYMSLLQIDFVEKRFDLAMSDLSKLQKIKPNDLQVAYITAVVYANVGKIDDAKKVLNSILNSIPDFQQAKDLLKQLGG